MSALSTALSLSCSECGHAVSRHVPVDGLLACTEVRRRGGSARRTFCECRRDPLALPLSVSPVSDSSTPSKELS